MANIKKLSVATVYGKIDLKKLVNSEGPIKIMRVIGNAVGHKSSTSQYGDWTALTGLFSGINLETGEESRSSQLFLPEVALTPIMVQLAQPGVRGVEFAIDITVKHNPDARPGGSAYEYGFDTVLTASESDPITRIKALIAEQGTAALPDGTKGADKGADKGGAKGKK